MFQEVQVLARESLLNQGMIMKISIISTICLWAVLWIAAAHAQPRIQWERSINDYISGNCHALIPLEDGVAAFGWARDSLSYYLVCLRYNEAGQLINRAAIPPYSSLQTSVVRAHDGGFIVKHGHALRKLSFDFELEWYMDYSEYAYDYFYDFAAAEEGYVAVGKIDPPGGDHYPDGWFVKVDENGEIVKERHFVDYLEEGDNYAWIELHAIAQHPEGGFIIDYRDYWADEHTIRYYSYLVHIAENGDSLGVIAERSADKIFTSPDIITLWKSGRVELVSYEGDLLGQGIFLSDMDDWSWHEAMTLSRGGGGAICGNSYHIGDNDWCFTYIYIVRFDDQLSERWWLHNPLRYGVGGAYTICQGGNGSYYVGGHRKRSANVNAVDIIVMKTTPDPNFVSGDNPSALPRALLLDPAYPNPFNARTCIPFQTAVRGEVRIEVFDVQGRAVYSTSGFYQPGAHVLEFQAGEMNTGIYFFRVSDAISMQIQKITLLR